MNIRNKAAILIKSFDRSWNNLIMMGIDDDTLNAVYDAVDCIDFGVDDVDMKALGKKLNLIYDTIKDNERFSSLDEDISMFMFAMNQ